MYCKDCKHWEHLLSDDGERDFSTCDVPWIEQYDVISKDSIAIYVSANDEWGLRAGIRTGPLFGCIKFKQK